MTYNIHPLIVHFPIALLFLYSVVKILPLRQFFSKVSWKHIERFLLIFGLLGAAAAIYTGGIAEHLVGPNKQLVEMHSTFAFASLGIYGFLLFLEIVGLIKPKYEGITNGVISKFLALAGLVAISITGMLGGVMVYGLSADPLAPMVLKLLNIHL